MKNRAVTNHMTMTVLLYVLTRFSSDSKVVCEGAMRMTAVELPHDATAI